MPTSVIINTLKQQIVDAVNNSGLPYCIVQYVLTEISNAVSEAAKAELKRDTEAASRAQQEEEPQGEE